MKIIDIVGDNYLGKWNKTRTACRGGLEENESETDCCIREVAEETGILVNASECLLEIDEYYENWKLISKYFICKVKGTTNTKLTEREQKVGMEARWNNEDNKRKSRYVL